MVFMITVSKDQHSSYERLVQEEHAKYLRALSTEETLDLYGDMYQLALEMQGRDSEPLVRTPKQWAGKVARRKRALNAFLRLDELRRNGASATSQTGTRPG